MGELLDRIKEPNDIKKIPPGEYKPLAKEIRQFLVKKVSHTGGHLASNLGVVELTIALHLCCELPYDQIVWDVGHQSYTHKILTGRQAGFNHLRQFGGMSGFPKREESDCDAFDTGHSSTSIGVALGLAKARDIKGEDHKVFAVIGDGALSGGMAYEALNNAARLKSNLIIVLNDNQMSISKNVGGMSNYLGKIRTNRNYNELKDDVEKVLSHVPGLGNQVAGKIRGVKDLLKRVFIPGMLFEDMGLTYIGPIDGHNVGQMVTAIQSASKMNEAVIVHVCTKKGKGYRPAEKDPSRFHGVSPFYVKDGSDRNQNNKKKSYTDIFSDAICNMAKEDASLTTISAAMPGGTGLKEMSQLYPERFFDVGIAEEHAVTFAAGMAAGGLHPIVALYSTFLQRAYDQMLHDVCIGNLPVIFAIDRAGLVGSDGETHQGIFDLAFTLSMPNLTVMTPKNGWELEQMLYCAHGLNCPVAIRYPRGTAWQGLEDCQEPVVHGKSEVIRQGKRVALLAAGTMVETAMEICDALILEGYDPTVINARFLKPFDEDMLHQLLKQHTLLITMEEGVVTGGFGQAIAAWYEGKDLEVHNVALPDQFIEHGSVEELKQKYGLDATSILENIHGWLSRR